MGDQDDLILGWGDAQNRPLHPWGSNGVGVNSGRKVRIARVGLLPAGPVGGPLPCWGWRTGRSKWSALAGQSISGRKSTRGASRCSSSTKGRPHWETWRGGVGQGGAFRGIYIYPFRDSRISGEFLAGSGPQFPIYRIGGRRGERGWSRVNALSSP